MSRSSRLTAVAALLFAAAIGLAGCTASNQSSSDSVEAPMGGSEAGSGAAPDEARADGSTTVAEGERQVVQTGYATITVPDPADAADEATRIATAAGGRVDDRTEQSADGTIAARASLTLRIPADELDQALDQLEALGDPVSVSVSANDVTASVTDLDARIAALQASVDRLQALLAQATSTADLIEIESSLSTRQADLDALAAQRAALGEQVAMSTLTVDLVAPGTVVGSGPQDFWQGLAAGWTALVAAASGFLVVLGVLLPWLLPLAVIAVVLALALRRAARRRAAAPAPAAPTPAPTGSAPPTSAPGE
ncbi:DUF4349 domain-containing protein [Microbacteriaceae bacterium VKM Ac-2855]|nr:DUF4349 domain-containing protein [Microbacteriaceae bacterium VKM Ac-2855]